MDGTDRDVVHAGGRVDLLGGVRGAADQPVVAHDRSRLIDRQVVLAEMHAVGAGGDRQVGTVVEHEERAGLVAARAERAGGAQDLVLRRVLLAQLHDVHAAGQRRRQQVIRVAAAGPRAAHEVQARPREPRASLVAGGDAHDRSVAVAGPSAGRSW